jgi:hypothetical protein
MQSYTLNEKNDVGINTNGVLGRFIRVFRLHTVAPEWQQREKLDPDPNQNGLHPQHCLFLWREYRTLLKKSITVRISLQFLIVCGQQFFTVTRKQKIKVMPTCLLFHR